MGKMVAKPCEYCRKTHTVRAADLARGWGKFCSKSCKAKEQEKRTHQHANYQDRKRKAQTVHRPASGYDALLAAINRKRRYMVMVGDDGRGYIDPEDDGIPEDDF
jgi:hypothetical protein